MMADPGNSIFNKRATEKLRNPDDLDKYVRVTNPSVWIILAACIVLAGGLLGWGLLGTVSTNVDCLGTCIDGEAICFLPSDKAADVNEGDEAIVDGTVMTVSSISEVPLSASEAKLWLDSDYLQSTLMDGDWAYLVKFEGDVSDLAEGRPVPVSITTDRVAPVTMVFGGNR